MSGEAETGLLLVISAPSGGGKTTVCQQMLLARPGLSRAITCTTRAPRPGERDGVDYYFLEPSTFQRQVEAGLFLEHASVFGNRYGTLKAEVLDKVRAGRDVLLAIDVQGAASVRAVAQEDKELRQALVTIFLTPPSMAELEQRLRKRATDRPEVIEKRLATARQEVARWREYDYLVVSATIPEDLRRMLSILEVEKMRINRAKLPDAGW
jgi:guanylate kinase